MLILPIKEKAKVESQNSSALIKERIFVGFKHKSMQPTKKNKNSIILLETSTMLGGSCFDTVVSKKVEEAEEESERAEGRE